MTNYMGKALFELKTIKFPSLGGVAKIQRIFDGVVILHFS
jgi:hypothetical protein